MRLRKARKCGSSRIAGDPLGIPEFGLSTLDSRLSDLPRVETLVCETLGRS
jgi:hypothetical protein